MVEVIALISIPVAALIASTIYALCAEIKKQRNREGKMAKYVGFRQGKVHESHVMSEYYCGGCGWPVTDHDSFCPECGGAFRESDADCMEEENAKLRELVHKYGEYTSQDRCEGCVCKSRCNDGEIEECWQLTEIRGLARELGVEVDE